MEVIPEILCNFGPWEHSGNCLNVINTINLIFYRYIPNYQTYAPDYRSKVDKKDTVWCEYQNGCGKICDRYTGSTVATRCYENTNCKGVNNGNYCYPAYIWAQQYASTAAYGTYLSNNWWSWSGNGRDKAYAFSVRCVTAIEY